VSSPTIATVTHDPSTRITGIVVEKPLSPAFVDDDLSLLERKNSV
jgi:hypothetical protein